MKTKYILVWETPDHEVKTKEAETLRELYMYSIENSVSGQYYKQVQVEVVER